MKYWSNEGTYEAEAKELNELVPMMGPADTYKGEVWRAATKIYHDYFNNGFGNFWMAPAAFLINNVELPAHVKDVLFQHANGNISYLNYGAEMDEMIDTVIVALRTFTDAPNTVDMWEYKPNWKLEQEFWEEEVEEDDWYDEYDEYEDD